MHEIQPPEPGDGFHAELSDLRPATRSSVREPDRAGVSPWDRRPSSGRRASRLAALITMGLLAVLVVMLLPGVRGAAIGIVIRPAPSPTLAPIIDQFYMLPNPPGVSVLLDHSPLRALPLPGMRPMRLAPGRHELEWQTTWFPFQPTHCVLSVPHAGSDTCVLAPGYSLPPGIVPPASLESFPSVIETRASLVTLPDNQANALMAALQSAFDALTSTAVVAPGEYYYSYAANVSGHAMRATQPLLATLRLRVRGPGAPGSCALSDGAVQPCRAPGQDCAEVCTLTDPPLAGSGRIWPAGVVVSADWSYTTLAGQPVAQHLGDPGQNASLAVVLLDWDGSRWSVTPLLGHHTSLPAADDALCDSARNWLAGGPLAMLLANAGSRTSQQARVGYASAPMAVGGCVVSITGQSAAGVSPPAPAALFLERFGVLLAANSAAHQLWPALPQADAAQAADAAAMATSAKLSH